MFEIGDIVRDKRFNRPLYGKVIVVDNERHRIVVETDKGNFSIHMNIVEIVKKNNTESLNQNL